VIRVAALFAISFAIACTPKPAGDAPDAALDAQAMEGGAIDGGADAASEEEKEPPTSSEELGARMKHLVEAIGQDNPDLAKDILFPRDAYLGLKDAKDPAKTWDKKVDTSFRKQVHRLHKRLKGNTPTFASFAVGPSVELAKVKKGDLKKPAWRVRHSKLTFTSDGKTQTIEIAEMTAYRGSWYVTKMR
jgi:hypothetical protein